jgi:hypothetical protein
MADDLPVRSGGQTAVNQKQQRNDDEKHDKGDDKPENEFFRPNMFEFRTDKSH